MKRALLALVSLSLLMSSASCIHDMAPSHPGPSPSPAPSASPSPSPSLAPDFAVVSTVFLNPDGSTVSNLSQVPQNAAIRFTFNANVNPSSVVVNATSVSSILLTYYDSQGNSVEMPGVNAAVSGRTLTLSASGGFYGGSSYVLDLNTDITDTSNHALSSSIEVKFTTTGTQPGSEMQLQITYDFGALGSTGIDHFILSYGTQSQSYSTQNVPIAIDQMPNTWQGLDTITSTYRATLPAGFTYYAIVKACLPSGQCSGPSPEAVMPFP